MRASRPNDGDNIDRFLHTTAVVGHSSNIWCLLKGPPLWHEVMTSRRGSLFHADALGLKFSLQYNDQSDDPTLIRLSEYLV